MILQGFSIGSAAEVLNAEAAKEEGGSDVGGGLWNDGGVELWSAK